jgi:hypothetical protein
LALEFEQEGLELAERAAFNSGCRFRGKPRDVRLAMSDQSRNKPEIALRSERLPFVGKRCFKIANWLVKLLEPEWVRILRALQRVHLQMIQSLRENQPVGVKAFGQRLFQFLWRAENFLPSGVLDLDPWFDAVRSRRGRSVHMCREANS